MKRYIKAYSQELLSGILFNFIPIPGEVPEMAVCNIQKLLALK